MILKFNQIPQNINPKWAASDQHGPNSRFGLRINVAWQAMVGAVWNGFFSLHDTQIIHESPILRNHANHQPYC